jgi:predicted nucleic acid-binding protein
MSTSVTRVYFDTCCLNRPFDDQTQEQIRRESRPILRILARLHRREWAWISSTHVDGELAQTPDPVRRGRVQQVATLAHEVVRVRDETEKRALRLQALGFGAGDALHIACAEEGKADVLLTTDQAFVRRAARHASELGVPVRNPLTFIAEMEGVDDARDDDGGGTGSRLQGAP